MYMKRIVTCLVSVFAATIGAWAVSAPPVTYTIDSEEAFAQWKSINSNQDAYEFRYDAAKKGAVYTQNKSEAANDWIISPAVTLTAGKAYTITCSVQNLSSYSTDKQDFNVYAGTAPEVASLTDKVFSVTSLSKSTWAVEKSDTYVAPATGTYYFGLNLVSKKYMGDFAVYSIKIETMPSYPGAVTDLAAVAAPKGALSATLTWKWPAVDNNGGNEVTVTGAKIYRGTTASFSTNDTYFVKSVEVNATPDAEYSVADEVTAAGKYYYKVVPFNAEGASPVTPASAEVFIGPSQSLSSVGNLKAEADTADNTRIILTWTAPTAADGGYFDVAGVGYTIKRTKDGGTAETIATDQKGILQYIDSTLTGLGAYVYTVHTVYNGNTSYSGAESDAVVAGGTMALPYTNDFTAQGSADLFTFFHGAECTRDWSWSYSKKALNFWGGGTADAWAVMPVFHLEAGKTYKLSFSARISNSNSPKNLGVSYGLSPDATGLTTRIFEEKITNTLGGQREVTFSVPATADYYIGLHCFGETNSNDLFVDDITLEETATAPMPVTEASVEADANGKLTAVVSWHNPALSTAGQALTAIDKVELRRGNELITTVTTPAPGSVSSYTDTVATPGNYTYAVTAYIGEIASEQVEVNSPWIGFDTPKAPDSVTVTVSDSVCRVAFSPVSEGMHGGYIDTTSLHYIVLRGDSVLASDVKTSPYIDQASDLPLAMYTYSVAAVNGEYTGEAAVSEPVMLGDAIALPYEPSFESKDAFELWTLNKWSYSTSGKKLSVSTNNSWAYTPPLDMKHGVCQVSFRATCYSSRYPEKITVYLTRDNAGVTSGENIYNLGEFDVKSVSFPDCIDVKFNVFNPGKHYIAFGSPEVSMFLSLTEVKVTQVSEQTDPTLGIGVNTADDDATVRYYNLQGISISHPTPGQIVIVRRGSKVTREVYRE